MRFHEEKENLKMEKTKNAQAVGRDISLERDIGSRVKWGDLVRCGCQASITGRLEMSGKSRRVLVEVV